MHIGRENDMQQPRLKKDIVFWISLAILAATVFLMLAILLHWISVGFFVGPIRFNHLLGWLGALYIAVVTPIFYVLKRRYPKKFKLLRDFHVFGFLTAFLLVSVHFAGQMSRPPQAFPELGEGIALYATVTALVLSGFLYRFQLLPVKPGKARAPHMNRSFHVSLTTAFYIIVVVHILLNILIA